MLRDVGAIPVARLRDLVDAVDDRELTVHEMFARANDVIAAASAPGAVGSAPRPKVERLAAGDVVDRVLAGAGWSEVGRGNPDRDNLAELLLRLRETGLFTDGEPILAWYAGKADEVATAEIASLPEDADRDEQLERMVVGTVVLGEVLATLRRLAQAHHSARRFDRPALVLRKATATDAEPAARLVRDAYRHYVPRIGREPYPMQQDYAEVVADGGTWLAEAEGRLVGLVVLVDHDDHVLVENLAVAPESQSEGVGGRLLALAEERAQRRGTPELRLYTHELMTENLAYYARRGFVETHRRAEQGFHRVFLSRRW